MIVGRTCAGKIDQRRTLARDPVLTRAPLHLVPAEAEREAHVGGQLGEQLALVAVEKVLLG
jgi:hypothetical protein